MKRLRNYYVNLRHPSSQNPISIERRRWIFPLAIGSIFSLFLLFLTTLTTSPTGSPLLSFYRSSAASSSVYVESKLRPLAVSLLPPPPRFAYLISGSAGDGKMLRRTLLALYHPRNQYVVHLDLESSAEERLEVEKYVKEHPIFRQFGNVRMITKANLVTYRGPTMVANTLHAAAILLKEGGDWDWFINLSASDYPLVTQDDLLHTFSYLPRDLNFIDHTSNIGWKEFQRAKPIIIDPGLYQTKKADVFWVTQRRSVPTAFKLFTGEDYLRERPQLFNFACLYNLKTTKLVLPVRRSDSVITNMWLNMDAHSYVKRGSWGGSAWMALSRSFIDYCIWGWDNLPRTVLMYYANFLSSPEGYFHTVICNAREFINTTVNSDLHFISWDNPPKQHPHYLNLNDMKKMVDSNAPFARKFPRDDPVLDKVDSELLSRGPGMIVPGGWCIGSGENGTDPCLVPGNTTLLRPTAGAKRLETLIASLLSTEKFRPRQCK